MNDKKNFPFRISSTSVKHYVIIVKFSSYIQNRGVIESLYCTYFYIKIKKIITGIDFVSLCSNTKC